MNKELEIWQFAAERLKRDESVMLLVVAESKGSSPGRPGFKMIVAEDELAGSIGGGVMEVNLVEQARSHLRQPGPPRFQGEAEPARNDKRKSPVSAPKSRILPQVHRKTAQNPSGMICSGQQTVVFFQLNRPNLKTVREAIRALRARQRRRLAISDLKFEISDLEAESPDYRFTRKGESEFLYEEKLGYKQTLFIVGGGHCALALSELMSKMDFYILLFDDRPNLNTLAKNRFVHEKHIIESYERIGDLIPSGASHYVVVMTLGYKTDEIVIRRLFDRNFKYFGVLGSKAKMKTLLRNLEKEGFAKEKLDRIRTPIGLPINSRTPEEIAVSIAAEIVAVKNAAGKLTSP